MNIAIVDDSASDRRHLEQILQKYAAINQLDMNIEHFSGGEAFLNHYQPYQYTIIFLDIFMNGITGIKTAEIIRETDEDRDVVEGAVVGVVFAALGRLCGFCPSLSPCAPFFSCN